MTDIERVARAIEERYLVDADFDLINPNDCAVAAIKAHKAALAEAGLVIVPREPSEAMFKVVYAPGLNRGFPNNISQNHAGAIWQAMIAAYKP